MTGDYGEEEDEPETTSRNVTEEPRMTQTQQRHEEQLNETGSLVVGAAGIARAVLSYLARL